MSEEQKVKISNANKLANKRFYDNGGVSWNKGKTKAEDNRIAQPWLGKKRGSPNKKWRDKISLALKGRKFSEEHKRKLKGGNSSSFKKGQKSWNKGIPMSKEQKEKLRQVHLGRKAADGTKLKMSLAHKGRKPYQITDEIRKNMSTSHIGKHCSPKSEFKKGHKLSKEIKKKMSESHIRNPNRNFRETKIELKIEAGLQIQGFIYEKQVPLCKTAIVDFYLPEHKIVIECDGCYYHSCPIHFPKNYREIRVRDINKDKVLKANGFKIYRFWEHEINESVEKCIGKLLI